MQIQVKYYMNLSKKINSRKKFYEFYLGNKITLI